MDTPTELEQELETVMLKLSRAQSDSDITEIENDIDALERKLDKALPFDSFEAAVEAIKKRDCCRGTIALQKGRNEYPGLFESWQESGLPSRPIFKGRAKAISDFEAIVDGLMMQNKKLSRTEALRQARILHPDKFEEYQKA
jgi:hypothetical protein